MATKKYYEEHKEEVKRKAREYYAQTAPERKAQKKVYYEKNRLTILPKQSIISKKNYRENPEKKLLRERRRRQTHRIQLLTEIGGCICKNCGFDDWRALQVDHVNGGGRQEHRTNKALKSAKRYHEHILKNPEQYQILCANCNNIKKYVNNECSSEKWKKLRT